MSTQKATQNKTAPTPQAIWKTPRYLLKEVSGIIIVSREEGFSLLELLTVLIVIAVLVAIAVPVYATLTNDAKIKACKANLRTIDGAINQYVIANDNNFPTDMDQIKPYLISLPKEPFDGSYELDSAPNGTWCICSLGHEY